MNGIHYINGRSRLLITFLAIFLLVSSCMVAERQKNKPMLFLIGDSTVKNGKGRGDGGLWGWGNFIASYFDSTRITVRNEALGGTSSRTFQTQGHWQKVLDQLKPGDFVLMQFGHNDSSPVNDTLRARGTIPGNGDESQEIDNLITKKHEVVHSYGWCLRKFIADAREKGATPVVLSPVPRNSWQNGRVNRAAGDYGKWAAEAAAQEQVPFIDLNQLIADRYDAAGEEKVQSTYFNTTDHTHTIAAGARLNAAALAAGIRAAKGCPLRKYLTRAARKSS